MIVITVSHPDSETTTSRFDSFPIRIGREADNDIVLASSSCSRYHAEIVEIQGVYKIVDLGSTNGIMVGKRRVSEYLLATDAGVTVGEYTLRFSIPQHETPKTMMMEVVTEAPSEATTVIPTLPAEPQVLYLHVGSGRGERSVKVVAGVDYVIGRSSGADLVVDDARCSGRHAVVSTRAGGFVIRDLESANGTFLNSEKIGEAALSEGDRVTIGRTDILVSEQPRDSVDDDDLMAKTQLGVPQQLASAQPDAAEARGAPSAAGATVPIPRHLWLAVAAVAAVVVCVVALSVVWRTLGRQSPAADDSSSSQLSGDAAEVIVQVIPVERKELTFDVTAAGSVQPQRRVTVSAEVPGRVLEVPVDEGSVVRRGELLARLDDRQIRLQISEASSSVSREQVDLAREDFERKQRLFDDGALTRSALDQAKNQHLTLESAFKSAQARIAQLRERQSKTRVTAPIEGIVARVAVSAGEFLAPGAPVVVLEDTDEVLMSVEISDRDVVKLRPLQVVEATSDAYPGRIFQGVVERIGGTANPVTKGFEVEARIGNPEGSLRSGMMLSLNILLEKRSSLVVPSSALLDEGGAQARVMVVVGGVVRSATVSLGGRKDRDVEVLHGLAEGDQVVVYGHDQLRDGQSVQTYRAE